MLVSSVDDLERCRRIVADDAPMIRFVVTMSDGVVFDIAGRSSVHACERAERFASDGSWATAVETRVAYDRKRAAEWVEYQRAHGFYVTTEVRS